MPVIDFSQRVDEADGALVKFAVKADGKTEGAFIYEAQVAFAIQNMDDARVAEKVAPGACEVFKRSQGDDNWKHNGTVTPGASITGVKATLSHAARGKVAIEGAVEVKGLTLRASKKAVVLVAKLVFGGQSAGMAANLADLLLSTCCVSFERMQGVLPFRTREANEANTGDVVVAWDDDVREHYVGRLVEVEGERMTLESFGNDYVARKADTIAVIKLDGDVAAMVKSYEDRCKRREISPSWEAIVLAAAEDGTALLNGGGVVTLSPEILERAVARLESGDAYLPDRDDEEEGVSVAH